MTLCIITVTDIHLILNLVSASMSFKSAESWTPICLPKFNDTGFLHTHVSYLPRDSPACLLLFSTDKEKFFELQECQKKIVDVSVYLVLPFAIVCLIVLSFSIAIARLCIYIFSKGYFVKSRCFLCINLTLFWILGNKHVCV